MGRLDRIKKEHERWKRELRASGYNMKTEDAEWLLERVDELAAVFKGETVLEYTPECGCEKCVQITKALSKLEE